MDFRDAMMKRDLSRAYGVDPLSVDKLPKRLLDIWMKVAKVEKEKRDLESQQNTGFPTQ
jgi:hypothetical protein